MMPSKEKMITNKELREIRLLDDRLTYLREKLALMHAAVQRPFNANSHGYDSLDCFSDRKEELDLTFSDVVSAEKFLEALQKLAAESD